MLQPVWLTISAAAAASEDASTAAGLQGLVRAWRAQADEDSAEFEAELVRLDAQFASQTGQKVQVTKCMSLTTSLHGLACSYNCKLRLTCWAHATSLHVCTVCICMNASIK